MIKFSDNPMIPLKTKEEVIESLFAKECRLEHLPNITEFYANQEIFITGGSGFIGKVLIEKLLRSCSDLKCIFVLMRPKKGKTIQQRLTAMSELPLFEPIRKVMPHVLDKLVPVAGDVTQLNLGLSNEDVDAMKNVSIIFHSAASVRFDDSLRDAILMNTRGTREIMKLAETLTKLKVVMHVSTTYSNTDRQDIEEKIYPSYVDWKKAIEICEKYDNDTLNTVAQHYTNFLPNTYVFSKNLAEHVTDDYKDKLPVVVYRPSIVISVMKDPLPGWVDNFNGPVGLLVGSGIGIVRTMYSNPNNRCDFTPVDVCVKGMIIAAWKEAHSIDKSTTPVYNCASYGLSTATLQQIVDIGKCLTERIPFEKMIFMPGGRITSNRCLNYVKLIFLQLLPALIIDLILRFKGHKPIMTKLQRKIYEANLALQYFTMNSWNFLNDNFIGLYGNLKLEDLKDFDCRDCFYFDLIHFMRICLVGTKKYLLHDNDENLRFTHIKFKVLKVFHRILSSLPYVVLFYYGFVKYDSIYHLKNYLLNY